MPIFACVDVQKVMSGYNKGKEIDDQFRTLVQNLQTKLKLRQANKLLTDEEFKQLADLKVLDKPTADDQKKIESLTATSNQREQEFTTLQQKPNATDAEKAKLKEYQDRIDKANAALASDQEKYQADLTKQDADNQRQNTEAIETAVSAVAKDKGIAMVFTKTIGPYPIVMYASTDISEDVIKKLNKK